MEVLDPLESELQLLPTLLDLGMAVVELATGVVAVAEGEAKAAVKAVVGADSVSRADHSRCSPCPACNPSTLSLVRHHRNSRRMCNCTFPCTCLAEVSATVAATAEGLPEAAAKTTIGVVRMRRDRRRHRASHSARRWSGP